MRPRRVLAMLALALVAASSTQHPPRTHVVHVQSASATSPVESPPPMLQSTTSTSTTTAPSSTSTSSTTVTRRRVVVAGSSVWDAIAACESGGDWADTRGGYEGGVHFMHDTWVRAGGRRFAEHAYEATREQQIEIAQSWLERTSWDQWPSCSRTVGVR